MRIFSLLFFIFIIFSGCSSTKLSHPKDMKEHQLSQEDDDLFDDFEDETTVKKVYDPFESYNRIMTSFNDKLITNVLTPVAKGYKKVLNIEVRKSVSNFFKNIYYPPRVVNNVLQGKFKNSFDETQRFVINTTIGVLGFFDPAKSYFHIKAHPEDLGQTLGFYGVGSGPHIVLPLFGPSNLRDMTGMYGDSYLSVIDYKDRNWVTLTDTWGEYLSVKSYENINEFSLNIQNYSKLKEDVVDLYPYLRDVYEQHRDKMIKE